MATKKDEKFETITLMPDQIPLVTDGLTQPTFYADNIRGTLVTPEVVKLNLVETKLETHKNTVVSVHVCTVVLPKSQVRAWAHFLTQVADENGLPPYLPTVVTPAANG